MARVIMTVRFDDALDEIEEAAFEARKETAEQELEDVERAYDGENDILGRPWTPLAPETIRKKGHDTILVEEEDMRSSGFVEGNSADETVDIGFGDSKVAIHEYGTENIPSRPIIQPMKTDLRHNTMLSRMAVSMRSRLLL